MPAANEHGGECHPEGASTCHPEGAKRPKDLPAGVPRFLPLVFLLIVPSLAFAQNWSEPIRPANLPAIQVQWRVWGIDRKSRQNIFEWVFSNTSDSSVAFNYRVETERGERRTGRISFKPRKKQMSGWLFSGDSLTRIEVDRRPFGVRD
ncbi:MAG TPA: hypothetical protein VI215_10915 [Bacteroidota bacterium]